MKWNVLNKKKLLVFLELETKDSAIRKALKTPQGHSAESELILALDITDFFDFFTVYSLC